MDNEKYTDPLDIASRNEAIATEDSIREARLLAKPHQQPDANGRFRITECVECGDEIGEKRLQVAIKNTLCLHCATAQERKTR